MDTPHWSERAGYLEALSLVHLAEDFVDPDRLTTPAVIQQLVERALEVADGPDAAETLFALAHLAAEFAYGMARLGGRTFAEVIPDEGVAAGSADDLIGYGPIAPERDEGPDKLLPGP